MIESKTVLRENSLGRALYALSSEIPEALVPTEAMENMLLLIEKLPLSLTSLCGYEVRLSGKGQQPPDFLLCIHEPAELLKLAEKPYPGFSDGYRSFSEAWKSAQRLQGQSVKNVWFEYDYSESLNLSKPNFFYGPSPGLTALEIQLISHDIFTRVNAEKYTSAALPGLFRCIQHLPYDVWVSQIGMMVSRDTSNIRLYVQGFTNAMLTGYLDQLQITHVSQGDDLHRMLRAIDPMVDYLGIDLDLNPGGGIEKHLGLECYFQHADKVLHFLEFLNAHGLCENDQCSALKTYFKVCRENQACRFKPFFHHFKLTYHPEIGFESKAYLGFVKNDTTGNKFFRF